MRRSLCLFLPLTLAVTLSLAAGDFPIRQSTNWENLPCVAYNSTDHEYLVVWGESILLGQFYIPGPVNGQRISETGELLGSPFQIFPLNVQPAVAYNSAANEYMVTSTWSGIRGQRVSSTGTLLGSATSLMSEASYSRIVYNTLSADYLLVGVGLLETGTNGSVAHLFTRRVGADGQALGSSLLVDSLGPWPSSGGPGFSVAYAPIQSPETPNGRYLLVLGGAAALVMLDSEGAPIDVVRDPYHPGVRYRYVPFETGSPLGGKFDADVAYGSVSGYSMSGPAFFVVWSDQNNRWNGTEWTGIWGRFVDATKIEYTTDEPVYDQAFPVSAIADHWAYDPYAETWRPKVAYNSAAEKFMVVWRETPGISPYNDTKVNHIRADKEFEAITMNPNDVLSATNGNENPGFPAIAASTVTGKGLAVWVDHRDSAATGWDIFGSVYTIAEINPPLPKTTWPVTTTADAGAGSLRQAILDANARIGLDTIAFNIPGSGLHTIQPSSELPAITDPVLIDGYTQPGSSVNTNAFADGLNTVLTMELDGTNVGGKAIGLRILGGQSIVRGLIINRFDTCGISLEEHGANIVEGNYIGTDATGTASRENYIGIQIRNVPGNRIGGTSPAARNLISGNDFDALRIEYPGASGNIVQGNYIGMDATGMVPLHNWNNGISIANAGDNIIGGTAGDAGNLITGNGWITSPFILTGGGAILINGVSGTGNIIQGNLIGTNVTGNARIDTMLMGVEIQSTNNILGGRDAGARNVISGNIEGVHLGGDSNRVEGNFIGTDISGTKPVGNRTGIAVFGANNIIGGLTASERNVISGNEREGIWMSGSGHKDNVIEGNFIGAQVDGHSPLGNGKEGILAQGPDYGCTIGGASDSAGNTIAFNGTDGVCIDKPVIGIRILHNSIYGNAHLGIDLGGGEEDEHGVTTNDTNDPDTGPNGLQNYPVLTSAEGGEFLSLTGSLNSTPGTTFRLEFFGTPAEDTASWREGQTFLGWTELTTDDKGNLNFALTIGTPVAAGRAITATATNPDGSTSEFSAPVITINPLGAKETDELPHETALLQNYPNPFNPKTGIRFQVSGVSEAGNRDQGSGISVKLVVYDVLGREVAVLVNERKAPGRYEAQFDASGLASGVYLCRMTAGDFVGCKKMVVVK